MSQSYPVRREGDAWVVYCGFDGEARQIICARREDAEALARIPIYQDEMRRMWKRIHDIEAGLVSPNRKWGEELWRLREGILTTIHVVEKVGWDPTGGALEGDVQLLEAIINALE